MTDDGVYLRLLSTASIHVRGFLSFLFSSFSVGGSDGDALRRAEAEKGSSLTHLRLVSCHRPSCPGL